MDPRVMWGEVVERLGLAPDGMRDDLVLYHGALGSLLIEISAGLSAHDLPIALRVWEPSARHAPFLLVDRTLVLTPPRAETGDRSFDEAVAIVFSGDGLLLRLHTEARRAVRAAVSQGALLSDSGATLPPTASLRLESVDSVMRAVQTLAQAVHGLREPSIAEIVQRYRHLDGAPEVDRCIAEWIDTSWQILPGEQLGMIAETLLERGAPLLPAALVERAAALWREAPDPMIDVLAATLRVRGPCPALQQLWSRPSVRRHPRVAKIVIDCLLREPSRSWLDITLLLEKPASTSSPRLVLRGRPYSGERVNVRVVPHESWGELLFEILPESTEDLLSYARLMISLDHPRIVPRLIELLYRSQSIAPVLAQRLLKTFHTNNRFERELIADASGNDVLFDALLALAPQAGAFVVALQPSDTKQQLRWIHTLSKMNTPDAEQALLGRFESGNSQEQIAAARALFHCGSSRVLPNIEAIASSWLAPPELRAVAREAAAAIRSRYVQGALSLAEPADGRLSLRKDR